jgi:hypothetical protein
LKETFDFSKIASILLMFFNPSFPLSREKNSKVMPKKKLTETIKELLKSDMEMLFLHQLDEEELRLLADSIRERID